ncbi:hypothetical protein AAVH_37143 [Aphelenchoides avenae]|nr:hypothetical protein AAVH_37143 [Aphelenchus avenae]
MNVPVAVEHCADTAPTANPNFHGVQVHICPNTRDRPGACVKFKGNYKGQYFVYRECWSHMWKDPRAYYHRMSGICFDDEMVQNFVGSSDNTICFCEDDLCNTGVTIRLPFSLVFLACAFLFA